MCNQCGLFTIYLLEASVLEVQVERRSGTQKQCLLFCMLAAEGAGAAGKKKPKVAEKTTVNWNFYFIADMQSFPIFRYLTLNIISSFKGGLLDSDSCTS